MLPGQASFPGPHAAVAAQTQPTSSVQQPSSSTTAASGPPEALVVSAYTAAVDALADDVEGVRLRALHLIALLGSRYPAVQMPGPRWLQYGAPLPLVDDAFQRLAACVGDGERDVRTRALLLMSGESPVALLLMLGCAILQYDGVHSALRTQAHALYLCLALLCNPPTFL